MNSSAKVIVAFFVACFFFSSNLLAQSMHGEPELDEAIPYSVPYEGQALWLSFTFEGWPEFPKYVSAVRLNSCWGLTAGHVMLDTMGSPTPRENYRVGNGSNRIYDRGIEREIVAHHVHPTWDGDWDGHKVDLALVRFAQPLPGPNLEIGTLGLGEHFEYAGYARPALPGVGELPADGQRRAWEAEVEGWGTGAGTISQQYSRARFEQGALPLGGVVTAGGSGSGGFNASGDLVALLVYGINSPDYMGTSYGVRLDLPEIKDWIESYTDDMSCIPPTHPTLSFQAVRRSFLTTDAVCKGNC